MSNRALLGPNGQPVNTGNGKPQPKAPPPEAWKQLCDLADATLYNEQVAFLNCNGSLAEKLTAMIECTFTVMAELPPNAPSRIQLAPHLFGTVTIAQAGASKIKVRAQDVRACFANLRRNGYQGFPMLSIDPKAILDAQRFDRRDRR